jgi:hypothetical protein
MKVTMRFIKYQGIAIVFLLALTGWLSMAAAGCLGQEPTQARVEEVDEVFRQGTVLLAETTGFIGALEEFDFENAQFYDNAIREIEMSRYAAEDMRENLKALGELDYSGDLEQLGQYIHEYIAAMEEALGELEVVYSGLEDILGAIEPVLIEEAVITQLDAPQSNQEWLERLNPLDEALKISLTELQEVEAPPALQGYQALFTDILSNMNKLVGELIAVVTGAASNVDVENNPDFIRMQEQLGIYVSLVEELYQGLAITRIDPYVEAVELEINRLYLGEGGG